MWTPYPIHEDCLSYPYGLLFPSTWNAYPIHVACLYHPRGLFIPSTLHAYPIHFVCLSHPRGLLIPSSLPDYPIHFFCSRIQFYLLLSPYFCFISFLYLDSNVLRDDALISLSCKPSIYVS